MQEPILEFKDLKEAYTSLREWQTRLFLNDWVIKLNIVPLHEMPVKDWAGENEYQEVNQSSVITLGALTEDAKNRICKVHQEVTLVHELLHLKLTFTDGAPHTMDGRFISTAEHILIEQMSKSLIMAKYNLSPDWFKNFEEE